MTFTKYSKNVTDTRGFHKVPLGNTAKAEHHSAVLHWMYSIIRNAYIHSVYPHKIDQYVVISTPLRNFCRVYTILQVRSTQYLSNIRIPSSILRVRDEDVISFDVDEGVLRGWLAQIQERRSSTNLGEIRVFSSVVVLVYEVYLNNTMLDGMCDA
jgi:hypothetical protein